MKFKTKAYVGNPGKKAEMKIDSLKAENEALKKQVDSLKIKLKIKWWKSSLPEYGLYAWLYIQYLQPAFRLLIFPYGYMIRNAILRFLLK